MKAALLDELLTISLKAVRVFGELVSSYLCEFVVNEDDSLIFVR